MSKTYKVVSVMEVDYVTEVELPENATPDQIIEAAEESAFWDPDFSDTSNTGVYYIDGVKVKNGSE